jgi:hypothetical protein
MRRHHRMAIEFEELRKFEFTFGTALLLRSGDHVPGGFSYEKPCGKKLFDTVLYSKMSK